MLRLLIPIVSLVLLASCSNTSDTFHLEGHLKKINQAEFYVYSPDGAITGRDTIKVASGRFAYDTPVNGNQTLIILFPNFSELPIFVEPGAEVKISGTASQLKTAEVSGTDDNELYTTFRQETAEMNDDQLKDAIEKFVGEHPQAAACRYLIDRHFIKTLTPDYQRALRCIEIILKHDPTNARFTLLKGQLEALIDGKENSSVPHFTARTIMGDTLTHDTLNAKVNVVNFYATWHSMAQTIQTTLKRHQKQYGDTIRVISVCIDADSARCRRTNKNDDSGIIYVCDGKMWDSPLLKTFGVGILPANIIANDKGKIIATNLTAKELTDSIKAMMKR